MIYPRFETKEKIVRRCDGKCPNRKRTTKGHPFIRRPFLYDIAFALGFSFSKQLHFFPFFLSEGRWSNNKTLSFLGICQSEHFSSFPFFCDKPSVTQHLLLLLLTLAWALGEISFLFFPLEEEFLSPRKYSNLNPEAYLSTRPPLLPIPSKGGVLWWTDRELALL